MGFRFFKIFSRIYERVTILANQINKPKNSLSNNRDINGVEEVLLDKNYIDY